MDSTVTTVILGALGAVLVYVFLKMMNTYNHWAKRGFKYVKPLPFFGNSLGTITFAKSQAEHYKSVYEAYPTEKYVGLFEFLHPALLVRDRDTIEKILIKDFSSFTDHGFEIFSDVNPRDESLFFMNGDKWRALRYKVSPTFTSGKLKTMFDEMSFCSESLIKRLKAQATKGDVDVNDAMAYYTMSAMATCVFGIDIKSNAKELDILRAAGRKLTHLTAFKYICFLLMADMPSVAKLLGASFTPKDVQAYFGNIVEQAIHHRTKFNVRRNDFIQLLLQLRAKGEIEIETKNREEGDYYDAEGDRLAQKLELTDDRLIAVAVSFISAGFDSLSGTGMYALYELAKNPRYQQELRRDIKQLVEKHGALTYEAIRDLPLLEMCIHEGMRMHPIAPTMIRCSTKDYVFDDGRMIEKGTKIIIPTLGIHYDPKYYEDPEVFKPERFKDGTTPYRCVHLPFGEGPRLCIGNRFALLLLKIGIARVILNFELEISSATRPLEMDKSTFIMRPASTVWFKLKETGLKNNAVPVK